MSNDALLSGDQVKIAAAGYVAEIATVGASLRTLRHDGRDLVVPFGADEVRPVYRGAILAPWPNRVVDGQYEFDGAANELPLTEPRRLHALHGLVVWNDFVVEHHDADRAVLSTEITAREGYPHSVRVVVEYRIDADGLHTSVTGENRGSGRAPWGTGPHPYVVAGQGHVDDWTLTLPASEVLDVTPDRLIPTGLVPVDVIEAGLFDLRTPTLIGERFIDHAFTDIARGQDGIAEVRVIAADGGGVVVRFGPECPWVQIHTADHVVPEYHRAGLAVEPMTCAPDAFNSGEERGLIVLDAGASHTASWTIAAVVA
jgi:aldose 1-epimerase